MADPGDPTADPSKAWPEGRRTVDAGTLTVDRTVPEADGPCREINYDPTVLPDGMRTSDDPFPAARSAAYAVSYNRRTAEAADYPRDASAGAIHERRSAAFTPVQRVLHWSMAVAILAMLFIGVGMVSTIRPDYLTLVSIHKPLGIAILVLALVRLAVRLRLGTPGLPRDLPAPMKLAAELSHYALYGLMFAMPLLGWGMLSAAAYPVQVLGVTLPAILPAERRAAHAPVECAPHAGLRVLRADPAPHRGRAVPRAGAPRRRLRGHVAGPDERRGGRPGGVTPFGQSDQSHSDPDRRHIACAASSFSISGIGWWV